MLLLVAWIKLPASQALTTRLVVISVLGFGEFRVWSYRGLVFFHYTAGCHFGAGSTRVPEGATASAPDVPHLHFSPVLGREQELQALASLLQQPQLQQAGITAGWPAGGCGLGMNMNTGRLLLLHINNTS